MAIIKEIDAEVLAHGSSMLLLPGEQPPEEQQPSEVQEAPPLPLLNHGQYGGRILRYCSSMHQNIARILSYQDQAYVLVDSFFGKDSREKDLRMVLALLKKVEHNLALGIPEIKDDTIFPGYFFNPDFKNFLVEDQGICWSISQIGGTHTVLDRKLPFGNCNKDALRNIVSYLRPDYEKKSSVRVVEGDPFGFKGWALTEYFYKSQFLFCLTFSYSNKNSIIIFSTVKDSKLQSQFLFCLTFLILIRTKKNKKSSSAQPSLVSEDDPLKMILSSKKSELEAIYVKAHIHVSQEVAEIINPSGVSDFDSSQLSDSIRILDDRLASAKLEAPNREPIILAVDDLIHAKREEEWFSEYNKRGNLFGLLSGDDKTIERVPKAKTLVCKIPSKFICTISGTKLEKA
ncbi:hypothetical protein Bca52824_028161 [Brassica carinata]|uniref:Uncharacterized protein n=1 Tax=Brassica carinata TaxID=52824 RepID=A0A8X7VBU2_BRACI|nr:hypothetical protein Bca52824_028161 [Brassica carinata]